MAASRRVRASIGRARKKRQARQQKTPKGILVAEGDSWFQYPGTHVLSVLDQMGYDVISVANAGDTIESMAYEEEQLDTLMATLEKLASRDRKPAAILISGGGNDLAGRALEVLLNYCHTSMPALEKAIVDAIINKRLKKAYLRLLAEISGGCEELFGNQIPILVHGYAHPVPDGRGYWGGFWILPGPWLKPAFDKKGYWTREKNIDTLEDLVDRFNDMLSTLTENRELQHVRYVNVRECLTNEKGYKKDWADELHPTSVLSRK